jgi:hypothetical protein
MVTTASGIINSVTSSGKSSEEENLDLLESTAVGSESVPEFLKPSESSPPTVAGDSLTEPGTLTPAEKSKDKIDDVSSILSKTASENENTEGTGDEAVAPGVGEGTEDSSKIVDVDGEGGSEIISPSFIHTTASGEGGSSSSEQFEINTEDPGLFPMIQGFIKFESSTVLNFDESF